MTVLEMQAQARPAMRWTEVCAADHPSPSRPAAQTTRAMTQSPVRPQPRSTGPVRDVALPVRTRPAVRGRTVGSTLVGPGRRVLVRPAVTTEARACRVEAPSVAGVVDDVPTWALLACGIAFGLIMLLVLAFLGGPAYA